MESVCGSEERLSVYTLNEKYDFDPVMQQSPRLFDEHIFGLPPWKTKGCSLLSREI